MRNGLLVIISLFFLSGINSAHACSCAIKSARGYYLDATIVFEGKVVRIEKSSGSMYRKIFIKAKEDGFVASPVYEKLEDYKNESDLIVVRTGHGGGDCGYLFSKNKKYLIFASTSASGDLFTNTCSGTTHEFKGKTLIRKISKFLGSPVDLDKN